MMPDAARRIHRGAAVAVAVGMVLSLIALASPAAAQGGGEDKVVICHIPPGNPENAHTIEVGEPAVAAHLAHGDSRGACEEDGDDFEDGRKVTICHIPPGNPENAHTITVGEAAVQAHLDHGDTLGACEEEACIGPDNVEATAEEGPQNRVTWDAFAGADSYNVYRAVGDGSFELIGTAPGDQDDPEFVDVDDGASPVVAGVTYRYEVSAVVDEAETERCETAEVTAIPVLPTLMAGAMAGLGGVGAYAVLRRRRGA